MKKRNLFMLVILLLTTSGLFWLSGCKKDENTVSNDVVERYLKFKTLFSSGNANTDKASEFMTVIGASKFNGKGLKVRYKGDDPSTGTDSTVVDSSGNWDYWEYKSCAVVTETDNGDGTFTTVFDYGTGCDEYGSVMRGKITYIWSVKNEVYFSKVIYDHYYSYGIEMDGYSEYSFTSDGNSYVVYGDGTNAGGSDSDSVKEGDFFFYWSGTSTGKDDILMTYDSGEKYVYQSTFSSLWDNNSYTIMQGDYYYKSETDGYEYTYNVINPLFYNYTCTDVFVAVKGIEKIYYKDKTETYSFVIDYGLGTCDNLATITENGESSVIDFGEMKDVYASDSDGTMTNSGN